MLSNITSFLEDTGNLLSVNQKKKTSKILDYKKKIITGQAVLIRSTDKRFRNCVGPFVDIYVGTNVGTSDIFFL